METRPNTFTLTNFWIDWLVMPFMLGLAVLTVYWGVRDWRVAASVGSALLGWLAALPLIVSAPGFVLLGLSMLVTEPYWEHRGLWLGQVLLIVVVSWEQQQLLSVFSTMIKVLGRAERSV